MKRIVVSAAVFAAMFTVTYLVLSYFPGAMIKLSAPPEIYFIENLKKLWFLKTVISSAVGLIASAVTYKELK